MIDWAFRVRGMSRVEWRSVESNDKSVAVAKRLGMTMEGVLRSASPMHGIRHDVQVWSILAQEWPAA